MFSFYSIEIHKSYLTIASAVWSNIFILIRTLCIYLIKSKDPVYVGVWGWLIGAYWSDYQDNFFEATSLFIAGF